MDKNLVFGFIGISNGYMVLLFYIVAKVIPKKITYSLSNTYLKSLIQSVSKPYTFRAKSVRFLYVLTIFNKRGL